MLPTQKPPQTYSRLFRPWDIKSSQNIEDNTNVKVENSINSTTYQVDSEQNKQTEKSSDSSIKLNESAVLFDPEHPNIFHSYTEEIPIDPSGFVSLPNYINADMPFVGFDPFTASAMEQEYARVLAEEAHAKMLTARKQRPKKFKCPHCDVAFSNNGQLKGHVRIHTGNEKDKLTILLWNGHNFVNKSQVNVRLNVMKIIVAKHSLEMKSLRGTNEFILVHVHIPVQVVVKDLADGII